jgi:hypothetical protein
MIKKILRWNRVVAGFVLVVLVRFGGCHVYDGAKQVRTVADMQSMCARIEGDKRKDRPITEARIKMLVGQVAGGQDGWGNHILVATRDTPKGSRYLLVSMGSDGKLDVSAPARYFDQAPADVLEDATRDIVFIDGSQVTNAGK